MTLQDIYITPGTRSLLTETGRQDATRGIDQYTGWQDLAKELGFDAQRHTPAQEAYLDGWYAARSDRPVNAQT